MEVLKGYVSTLKFVVPSGLTTATFDVYRGETQVGATGNAVIDGTVAEVTLPYAATTQDGDIRVVLHFTHESTSYNPEKTVSVVTPVLELHEVKAILGDDATDDEVRSVEAAVRHVINAHTGQTFGYSEKTIVVPGTGDRSLRLPERLISFTVLETPEATYNTAGFSIASDGWYLRLYQSSLLTIKQMPPEFSLDRGPVIQTPYTSYWSNFSRSRTFSITGKWGYESVPAQVKEAARLLVNDYACSEALYRDRYLESIKAADWRLQFSSQAWDYTGNVRADQLLADYVLLNWAVV